MATGIGNLPNPGMAFTPFDILTAEEMNMMVDNIESLATGAGIGDGAITSDKIDWATLDTGWINPSHASGITGSGQFRRVGSTVYGRGNLAKSGGNLLSGDVLCTLPVGMRPSVAVLVVSIGVGSFIMKMEVRTNGEVLVASPPTGNTTYTSLSPVIFPIG